MKKNRFAEMCLNIADVVDEKAEEENMWFVKDLGTGCRVVSNVLREGIKELIDLKQEYSKLRISYKLAKESEFEAREFLHYIFGDSEVDCLKDEYKAKIKEFVMSLDAYKGDEEVTE